MAFGFGSSTGGGATCIKPTRASTPSTVEVEMKIREDTYEKMPNNFFREYYFGCYIEVIYASNGIDKDPVTHIGHVLTVDTDHLTALLVRRATEDDEKLPAPWTWDSETDAPWTVGFRRLSDQEYMMRKLQGFYFPEDLV
jgi:hypothetical protein